MTRMTRCLFGDGFSSRNEGRWDGRLGLPLTSISLHTLSSNLFYPPPLLLPSSPLLSYIDRRNPSPTLPAVSPVPFAAPALTNRTRTLAPFRHCARSPPPRLSIHCRLTVNIWPSLPRTGRQFISEPIFLAFFFLAPL